MPTVSETAKELGMTRDQLHYLIRTNFVEPHKEGKRFLLTDTDVEKIRHRLQEKTKLSAAIIQLQVTGNRTGAAVEELKARFPEVVWAAGAWGEASVIALLEAPKLEKIAAIPFDLGRWDYVNHTKTSIIPPEYYHVKETPILANERLAVILINYFLTSAEKRSGRTNRRVLEDLGEIPEVKRWGTLLGQWDAFAEVRYADADRLYSIVMEEISEFEGVANTTTILTMRKLRRERGEFDSSRQPGLAPGLPG